MKIGIDIDEVIVEFVKGYLKVYEQIYGRNFSFEEIISYNFWEVLGISKEDAYKSVYQFYNTNEFENLDFIEGAKEAIKVLSEKNEILLITSRPLFTNEKTQIFFQKHFPNFSFEIIHSGGFHPQGKNKEDICKERGIKIMIEDHVDYALKCAEKGIKVFLLDKPWNQNMQEHEKIKRVKNWNEILEKLK